MRNNDINCCLKFIAPSTDAASSCSIGTDLRLAKNVSVTKGNVFHGIIVIIDGQT